MARRTTAPEAVEIRYDLSDLPTAQHKAGLAGLMLAIESLKERSKKSPEAIPSETIPEIVEGPDNVGVKIRYTERSTAKLFDDLYDATIVEIASKSKWAGKAPKREEPFEEKDPKTGKLRQSKRFIYDIVQPQGTMLAAWLPEMPSDRGWLKLWREMLWRIPRGNPQSREPFEQRAEGKPCKEGTEAWADLVKAHEAAAANSFAVGAVAGSLWLGAQANNAEGVPFVGRVEQNLLLHFWPLTVMISVPQVIKNDGKVESVGFVIAVPEVSRLKRFCDKLPTAFASLSNESRGIRPAQALIDLPAQGALEFVSSVARIKVAQEEDNPAWSVSAIEYLHLDRQGNNIKLLASGRVPPDLVLLDEYRKIVGNPGDAPPYRNPLFRAALIRALLRNTPWWGEMLPLFMERDAGFFVPTANADEAVARLPWFWNDARNRLNLDEENYQRRKTMQKTLGGVSSSANSESNPLTSLITRLVRTYVFRRAEERSGVRLEAFREGERVSWERVPGDFHAEKSKVAEGLFLEFRSRRDRAFIDHFAQTFFSVQQFLPDRDQEQLAATLLDENQIDDVKTLTLMALSAVSWTAQRPNQKGNDE